MCDIGWGSQSYDIKPIPADFDEVTGHLDEDDFRVRRRTVCHPHSSPLRAAMPPPA